MLRLTEVRKERGWSQARLSYVAEVPASVISWIENSRYVPYPVQLSRLAQALGVADAQSLLDPVDESQPAQVSG